ncbi:hormogonium polysaccharide biosynthesis protein HpsA [Anabaena cylindrica UHCC 0172]|uniref:hormogonium polysaccharide biosynthesis protein HpsA n=1 Tax=Anabaena cylindrica TaxID=1165 RepID=UPI002B21D1CE|nr:hormogonium polysaccharide biosynthesis protein HpsA [Anabaena cylindrica]MEA5551286.1 hormogonium polysaccharide biosynthesis protein HpsA [Anabaena cylindrica UHCC 0172]
MSQKRQSVQAMLRISKKNIRKFLRAAKKQLIYLVRTTFRINRNRETANAGFILPTVAMVSIVVVLLTIAIMFRSFDRAKNASNVRVNEAVINAATPAIDRARAKINKLFEDKRLPRATPADSVLYETLTNNINEYTFGDETKLRLVSGTDESLTAWRFPVDTDNNGKFDSYTLYGIYFRNPPLSGSQYTRARNPLESRTQPMAANNGEAGCEDTFGTSATLVGINGWFRFSSRLKKAFFVYTATVPITTTATIPTATATNYEVYKGNKGFSAVEYQQDRVQIPVINNAVLYEDDLELTPGADFKLNGRVFTNSNLLVGSDGADITLHQISSKDSCFYEPDNAKVIVGGNIGIGRFTNAGDLNNGAIVHLFNGTGNVSTSQIKDHKTVTDNPSLIAYNSLAYVQRINRLVAAQIAIDNDGDTDPTEVKEGIQKTKNELGLDSYTTEEEERFRTEQLQLYFQRRTRRVPYREVAFGGDALGTYATTTPLQGSGDTLRPINIWSFPTNPANGKVGTGYAGLTLALNGTNKLYPSATEPTRLQTTYGGKEQYLGDRISVGNNLPQLWFKGGVFVGPNATDTQSITGINWDNPTTPTVPRTRRSLVETLADVGSTDRDGVWEQAAATVPDNPQEPIGGLRVITGAGIYLPEGYTTTGKNDTTDTTYDLAKAGTIKIWSDMMPVASSTATSPSSTVDPTIILPNALTPYLRMRATAVYHYKSTGYNEDTPVPIACVSSYYDPTSENLARNKSGLADVSPVDRLTTQPYNTALNTNAGNSHNGIVYGAPNKAVSDYQNVLNYQAQLKYPNGRWVNEPLKTALAKTAANRTIAEQSAIDAEICALQIFDGSIPAPSTPLPIPHGAIQEVAFLDARQVKAVHNDLTPGVETFTNAAGFCPQASGDCPLGIPAANKAQVPAAADYDLPLRDRQPLEIRATVLNIGQLRTTAIGGTTPSQEYLLPNSGIIYATRNDALIDASSALTDATAKKSESTVDYKLDPTRRPNGIMLLNGSEIWREEDYRDAEKGLILTTNLPVYLKGDFNLHDEQEFTTALTDDWGNFYTRAKSTRNPNFACRPNDLRLPNCTTGDKWRPASILADAITALSNNFRLGFRNEGDYDLNNNLGDSESITALKNVGFFANTFATNASWYNTGATLRGYPKDLESTPNAFQGSTYVNNFVTPIQRRATFNEYLMEICPKLPVSACTADDWYVNYDAPGSANNIRLWKPTGDTTSNVLLTDGTVPASSLNAGTTVDAPATGLLRYPRRVAFKRLSSTDPLTNGILVLDNNTTFKRPTPLGIDSSGNVAEYPYGASNTNNPRVVTNNNALWFKTTTNTTNPRTDTNNDPVVASGKVLVLANETLNPTKDSHPRLLPVLQVDAPFGTPPSSSSTDVGTNSNSNWLQVATETTFNVIMAAGDTPARPTEDNGGLHNFTRFLEHWNPTSTNVKARINGSFMQLKKSAYATASFTTSLEGAANSLLYQIGINGGRGSFYLPPERQWGYDVGLLSQSPDLFAQKLVTIPPDKPDEYVREVGRDDIWVATLLCAKDTKGTTSTSDDTFAIDSDQYGTCP